MSLRSIKILFMSLLFTGCGVSTSTTSSLKVRMYGIFKQPENATGDGTPRSQTYTLENVVLTKSDGTQVDLFDEDPEDVKIIDRGQIVFKKDDMTEYDGVTFSSLLIQFNPEVKVMSKAGVESTIRLASGDLSINESFESKKQKSQVLTIKIAWGDTITVSEDGTEAVSLPSFSLAYE